MRFIGYHMKCLIGFQSNMVMVGTIVGDNDRSMDRYIWDKVSCAGILHK